MKPENKTDERSDLVKAMGNCTSDPSPALPTGEGDLKYRCIESYDKTNHAQDLESGEKKRENITANPYIYPLIKDYRENLIDPQTETELLLWQYLRKINTFNPLIPLIIHHGKTPTQNHPPFLHYRTAFGVLSF
jgi:hypothetical protein